MGPERFETRVEELISALSTMDRLALREILNPGQRLMEKENIIDSLIVPALEEIGRRWEEGTLAISQVYMAGVLIEEAITSLFPETDSNESNQARVATVVLEDYHMLGKESLLLTSLGQDTHRLDMEGETLSK